MSHWRSHWLVAGLMVGILMLQLSHLQDSVRELIFLLTEIQQRQEACFRN